MSDETLIYLASLPVSELQLLVAHAKEVKSRELEEANNKLRELEEANNKLRKYEADMEIVRKTKEFYKAFSLSYEETIQFIAHIAKVRTIVKKYPNTHFIQYYTTVRRGFTTTYKVSMDIHPGQRLLEDDHLQKIENLINTTLKSLSVYESADYMLIEPNVTSLHENVHMMK